MKFRLKLPTIAVDIQERLFQVLSSSLFFIAIFISFVVEDGFANIAIFYAILGVISLNFPKFGLLDCIFGQRDLNSMNVYFFATHMFSLFFGIAIITISLIFTLSDAEPKVAQFSIDIAFVVICITACVWFIRLLKASWNYVLYEEFNYLYKPLPENTEKS